MAQEVSDPDVFSIQDIISHRMCKTGRRYKVLWEGYPASEATWQHEGDFLDERAKETLADYKRRKKLDLECSRALAPEGRLPRRRPPAVMEALPPTMGPSLPIVARKTTRRDHLS